jgi:hypothetical protein
MPQRSSTSRYILTALAIILVITAFILVGLNALQLQRGNGLGLSLLSKQTDEAYKEGYLAAREKYKTLCPLPAATNILTGTVVSNDGTTMRVQETSLDTDPKVDGVNDIRTITLAPSATIVEIERKTPQQLAAENPVATNKPQVPANPFTQKTIHLTDITPGMTVAVQSQDDVRLAPSIVASTITLAK